MADVTLASIIEEKVNSTVFNSNENAKYLCNIHRYLQNEVFNFALDIIMNMAENRYDDRNKVAVLLSKKIKEFLDENQFVIDGDDMIPYKKYLERFN